MDWKPPLGHNSMSVCSQYFSIASSLVRDFVIKNQFGQEHFISPSIDASAHFPSHKCRSIGYPQRIGSQQIPSNKQALYGQMSPDCISSSIVILKIFIEFLLFSVFQTAFIKFFCKFFYFLYKIYRSYACHSIPGPTQILGSTISI